MSVYSIEFAPAACRQIKALPAKAKRRIAVKIDGLALTPRPAGCTKLKGADDIYRIRTGDHRILYQVKDDSLLVLIVKVAHRKEVYNK